MVYGLDLGIGIHLANKMPGQSTATQVHYTLVYLRN
jgi:hypothetical protein